MFYKIINILLDLCLNVQLLYKNKFIATIDYENYQLNYLYLTSLIPLILYQKFIYSNYLYKIEDTLYVSGHKNIIPPLLTDIVLIDNNGDETSIFDLVNKYHCSTPLWIILTHEKLLDNSDKLKVSINRILSTETKEFNIDDIFDSNICEICKNKTN
jgi:hypothetical protein